MTIQQQQQTIIENQQKQISALQTEIEALKLKYCPGGVRVCQFCGASLPYVDKNDN